MQNQKVDEFFKQLYQKTKDEILIYIIAKCGDTHEIQDIFQETFMEFVKLLRKKGTASLKQPEAVVMAIAKRKISQHYKLRQKLGMDKVCHGQLEGAGEELADFEDFTVEDTMLKKETLEQIGKIIEKQDILTRKIFYMGFYMEVPFKKIAEMLEISEETVKNHLHKVLKSMKQELKWGE